MFPLPGIVFPSSPVSSDHLESGLRLLPGYRLFSPDQAELPFLAGSDESRTATICEALVDSGTGILVAARGGHGALRLNAAAILETLARTPKPLVGFSDVTALHHLWRRARVPSVHGPGITQLSQLPPEHLGRVLGFLTTGELPELRVELVPQHVPSGCGLLEGDLVGGNLVVAASAAGTPWSISYTDSVVFFEEIREAPYRLDRCLWQVFHATDLARAAAIVFGEFTECPGFDLQFLVQTCRRYAPKCPVFSGFPAGHGTLNLAFAYGRKAELEPYTGELRQKALSVAGMS